MTDGPQRAGPEFEALEVPAHLASQERVSPLVNLFLAVLVSFIVLVAAFGTVRFVTRVWSGEHETRIVWDGPEHPLEGSPNPLQAIEFDGWEHCEWQSIRFLVVPAAEIPGRELIEAQLATSIRTST